MDSGTLLLSNLSLSDWFRFIAVAARLELLRAARRLQSAVSAQSREFRRLRPKEQASAIAVFLAIAIAFKLRSRLCFLAARVLLETARLIGGPKFREYLKSLTCEVISVPHGLNTSATETQTSNPDLHSSTRNLVPSRDEREFTPQRTSEDASVDVAHSLVLQKTFSTEHSAKNAPLTYPPIPTPSAVDTLPELESRSQSTPLSSAPTTPLRASDEEFLPDPESLNTLLARHACPRIPNEVSLQIGVLGATNAVAVAHGNIGLASSRELCEATGLDSQHPQHSFSSELDDAVARVLRLEHKLRGACRKETFVGSAGWIFEWEMSGLTMHSIAVPGSFMLLGAVIFNLVSSPGSSVPLVRACKTLPSSHTIPEILSALRTLSCRREWDQQFDKGRVLAALNADDALLHHVHKGSFPLAPRDLVLAETTRGLGGPDVVYVATSVCAETGDIPGVVVPVKGENGCVRVENAFYGWLLRDLGGSGIEVVYFVHADLKAAIPRALVKLALNSAPHIITAVQTHLKTVGPPPFLVAPPTVVDSQATSPHPQASNALPTIAAGSWSPLSHAFDATLAFTNDESTCKQRERSHQFALALPYESYGKHGCTVSAHCSSPYAATVAPVVPARVSVHVYVGPGVPPAADARRRASRVLKGIAPHTCFAVILVHITVTAAAAAPVFIRVSVRDADHTDSTLDDGPQVIANGAPALPVVC
ncbi:hypothetical protein HDU83_002355 [Entophlyctis luteolus]|nr:hypothetical protein HDU83_002355 [Entophlyctis luteolus]